MITGGREPAENDPGRPQGRLAIAMVIAAVVATAALTDAKAHSGRWMTAAELRAAFANKTIEGTYSNGLPFVEVYRGNMRLEYREPGRDLAGRWSIVDDTFCTLYDAVPTGGCYRVLQDSANCFTFYFTASDEQAVIEQQGPGPQWTARAWVSDATSTCKAVPAV
jgi:hypothetical protein